MATRRTCQKGEDAERPNCLAAPDTTGHCLVECLRSGGRILLPIMAGLASNLTVLNGFVDDSIAASFSDGIPNGETCLTSVKAEIPT
jgi:hypothetical protein